MSQKTKHVTIPAIQARKGREPIVCLTAYTAPMAHLLDASVDLLLVGDSLGMVVYGMENTLGVTLDMMINHGSAVKRASSHACVIVDLPFGSYQESPQTAFRSAAKVMAKTGCDGVKLEGGTEMSETIAFLTARGIPVMGHIGLRPQSANLAGGYRVYGQNEEEALRICTDAVAVCEAGAFAVVIEKTVASLAQKITKKITIPTIGIGASNTCDGQILVTEDLIGLFERFTPRFVKQYTQLADVIRQAVATYAKDVRSRDFPAPEHCCEVEKNKTTS